MSVELESFDYRLTNVYKMIVNMLKIIVKLISLALTSLW